ncbi:D-alanyl-D-alanine carboxypeptidase [uncultured Croceitalea sp.]|uniref:D-alanyl-D-alanine carboxypeptidase n=1 Tax=uncultured Croceitalea sp. TaxID=1798908 RepID=UPI003305D305
MLNPTKKEIQNTLNQLFNYNFWFLPFSFILLSSCATSKTNRLTKDITEVVNSSFYDNQFTGLLLVDPQKKDTLITLNSTKYFTPASNVKIITLYSALQVLPQNIPTLKFLYQNDTLYAEPTGDPTWLHPYFKDSTALKFLKGYGKIALNFHSFHEDGFGPGWAWEDYQYYFSPERSALPLYGNVMTVFKPNAHDISPKYFKDSLIFKDKKPLRDLRLNSFRIPPTLTDTLEIPFLTSSRLTKALLQEKLNADITINVGHPNGAKEVLYGIDTDSVYRRMLYKSDNFLAEQLMLTTSSIISDTLKFSIARDHIFENHLSDLRQPPRWVDGSGLSRYNLFTPESMVHVLSKLWHTVPRQRLFHLFPTWNAEGTIPKEKEATTNSFVHAKSGGMGNVYNLSGYLETKSGKHLIFSFMNNHFRQPSSTVRQHMYHILKMVHDTY